MFYIFFHIIYTQIYSITYTLLTFFKNGFLLTKIYTIIQHPVWTTLYALTHGVYYLNIIIMVEDSLISENRWCLHWQPHSSTIMSSWCRRVKSSLWKYSMDSGLRRVGTHDGQETLCGWWCRRRLWKTGEQHVSNTAAPQSPSVGVLSLSADLHVCVVAGIEGLIQRRWALPLTPIGVKALWMNNPRVPADVVEIHPHVHPATQLPLDRLLCRCCCCRRHHRGWCFLSFSFSQSLHLVPFVASTLTVMIPSAQGDVLGVFHSV